MWYAKSAQGLDSCYRLFITDSNEIRRRKPEWEKNEKWIRLLNLSNFLILFSFFFFISFILVLFASSFICRSFPFLCVFVRAHYARLPFYSLECTLHKSPRAIFLSDGKKVCLRCNIYWSHLCTPFNLFSRKHEKKRTAWRKKNMLSIAFVLKVLSRA